MQLAQMNIGRLVAPKEDPRVAEFIDNLDRINAMAEASAGFVWRLVDDTGADATDIRPFDDTTLVNISVWADFESLQAFVYRSEHKLFVRRRKEWFLHMDGPVFVLWWVPEGHIPTPQEGKERLEHLRQHGPGPQAFTFAKCYDPAEVAA